MSEYFIYMLKAGISLSVLYLAYWALLRNDTHFVWNRFMLIFLVMISFVFPLLHRGVLNSTPLLQDIPTVVIHFSGKDMPVVSTGTIPGQSVASSSINFMRLFMIIYLAGALLVFARLVYQAIFLHAVSRLSKKIRYDRYTIISMKSDMAPYSYFNRIFIPEGSLNEHALESIIAHERCHLSQGHYIDLFIIEILSIIQWFNPFIWGYEKSIKEIHEYLADEAVLDSGKDRAGYQALLVNQAMGGPVFILTNQFNQSLIKKRIMMMKKMKSSRIAKVKSLLILPVIAALMLAFSDPSNAISEVRSGHAITVTGHVSDKLTGASLPGSIVAIKGTNIGTRVDERGNYSIKVDDGEKDVLIFNSMGYKSTEIAVEANMIINVQLEQDAVVLDLNVSNEVNTEVNTVGKSNGGNLHEGDFEAKEVMPSFPGGNAALLKFLETHIQYPADAKKAGAQGKVYVNFVVDAKGHISNAKVMRSTYPSLNDEALRLVGLMPAWNPAMHDGEAMSMAVTFPIEFKIK